MEALKYQQLAARTLETEERTFTPAENMLIVGALGLGGEAGEVSDLVKKHFYHNKPMDITELKKEVGDVAWYLAAICTAFDINFSEVLEGNIEKLKARYPEGFLEGVGRKGGGGE